MTTISQTQVERSAEGGTRMGRISQNANAILAIAFRDFLKLMRDRARIAGTFVFPLIFIGFLGGGMQASFGGDAGYNYLAFIFTGVLAQTLFQSTAMGIISLMEDRANDFSQAIFVSPISRYAIVFGKILGETFVALPQAAVILAFGALLGIGLGAPQVLGLIAASLLTCVFGGAFGMMVLGFLPSRRAADQLFPFVFLPQFVIAGVFVPLTVLPEPLKWLSLIAPMRYPVDLMRGLFYGGGEEAAMVVMEPAWVNLVVIAGAFAVFMLIGTVMFVRAERNR